ncbi:hypothetical protein AOLI_G00188480 [Acnodon oligacanthus]
MGGGQEGRRVPEAVVEGGGGAGLIFRGLADGEIDSLAPTQTSFSIIGGRFRRREKVVEMEEGSPEDSRKKTQSTQTDQTDGNGLWLGLLVMGGVALLLALAYLSRKTCFSERKEDCEVPHDDVYTTIEYATCNKGHSA